jgi:hypothetical protein
LHFSKKWANMTNLQATPLLLDESDAVLCNKIEEILNERQGFENITETGSNTVIVGSVRGGWPKPHSCLSELLDQATEFQRDWSSMTDPIFWDFIEWIERK